MKNNYLDFEQPVAELEEKIGQLRFMQSESAVDIAEEIAKLRQKCDKQIQEIYAKLTPWQMAMVARHPQRPYTLDYASRCFTDFHELHGDRHFGDDEAVVGGLARLNGQTVMLIGHQKGRDAKERIRRNFGMPLPEGYRKALRLMKLAERFEVPVITLIDTPGAFAGIGAEERGQSEAIGRNLYEMAQLRVPIVSIVIGEGGSGGALALGVSDQIMMLQYSVYSVISPEGCAAILWKSAEKAPEAAQTLGITSERLKTLGLIDRVIDEPVGGAHRDWDQMASLVKRALTDSLRQLGGMRMPELLARRFDRLMSYGRFKDANV